MNNCNHSTCHHCNTHHKSCVSIVPIFNHLEDEQMDEIVKTIKPGKYKKGEIIYSAGDQSDSLYIVNKGRIRIYRLSESGKEQLVRILAVGDFTESWHYSVNRLMSHMPRPWRIPRYV